MRNLRILIVLCIHQVHSCKQTSIASHSHIAFQFFRPKAFTSSSSLIYNPISPNYDQHRGVSLTSTILFARGGRGGKKDKKSNKTISKSNLPTKDCVVCGRPFTWRKKWERCWDEVTCCSKACNSKRRSGEVLLD